MSEGNSRQSEERAANTSVQNLKQQFRTIQEKAGASLASQNGNGPKRGQPGQQQAATEKASGVATNSNMSGSSNSRVQTAHQKNRSG